MLVFDETSSLCNSPTVQMPVQLKQQVIKIIVHLSSKVYYGEAPMKRKEQIPQRLGVCCVPTAVLTAGATMWTKETQFLPSRSARSGEGTHNAQAEMHGHSAVMGIHKQETLREDTKAFIQTSLSEKASPKR